MAVISIAIYNFFRERKLLLYATLVLSFILFLFLGSKVEYEEDIAKLLPSSKGGSEKLVFNNLKVKDKIFVLFVPESDSVSRADLAAFGDAFVDSLRSMDSSGGIFSDVLNKVDDEMIMQGMKVLFNNAPIFLDSLDYKVLDSLVSPSHISSQMEENMMLLQSPAGLAFGDLISNDPLAFRNIFKEKLSNLGGGEGSDFVILDNHFFAADSSFAIAFISPNFQLFNSKDGEKLVSMIEACSDSFSRQQPSISVYYHGGPAQGVHNARQIKSDLVLTLSISISLICLIFLFCFKNKSTLLYILLPVLYGSLFSLSVIYLTVGKMSLLAIAIGAIVLGVALSYCLHIVTHHKYVGDPIRLLNDQTKPLCLGCLTTVGAFSALLFTQSELLHDFGIFASLALIGTTLFCLIFLPHFFREKDNRRSDNAFKLIEQINMYPYERSKVLVCAIALLCVVCFFLKNRVEFDSNLRNIGYNNPRVLASVGMMDRQHAAGYCTTYYATTSRSLDSALVLNTKLHHVLDSLTADGLVSSYSKSSSLFIPEEQQKKRIEMWNAFWTDEKKKSIKSIVSSSASKFGLTLDYFAPFLSNLDKTYTPISLYESGVLPKSVLCNIIEKTDGSYLVFTPVFTKNENVAEVSKILSAEDDSFVVIDPFYYTKSLVSIIMEDFSLTLSISSLFVLVVLLLSYRNIMLVLIAFSPMMLSWNVVLGLMGIFGLKFNLINTVISTFIFGIGVDYSIFIMDGLLASLRSDSRLLSFHKTAIFFSALVLIIGVASLLFAAHPAVSSVGLSTMIGMTTVVVISYTIEPFLFNLLVRRPIMKKKSLFYLRNIKRRYCGYNE